MAGSFEDVLAEALVAHELEGAAGFERIAAAHPEHAAALRSDLARLRDLGLLLRNTQVAPRTDEPASAAKAVPGFPERLGEFRLLQRLGGGGMGVVYLAEQASLGRRVALKLVRPELLYFPGAHDRFRREVAAIARLQHPGIVPVFSAGEEAGVPWLAMEHVEGASLDRVLAHLAGRDPAKLTGADLQVAVAQLAAPTATGMPPTEGSPFTGPWAHACLRIVRAVAAALQHAHERGVLHRDVKPSNVMLTRDGRALLLDFGLALADGATRLTGSGGQLGSPAYMSPEQMRGDPKHLDVRTDVYSLGVTLYELLSLRMPFVGDSAASTRDLVLAGRPAPLRLLHRALPRDADVVCRKAMDVEPRQRYATAAAFAADLDNVLALRPIAARPPGALVRARRWAQRHPARATAALAAALLFGVAPTVFLLQQQAANRAVLRALANVKVQRDRAREAVETMLTRVASEDLLELPRMLPVRRDLLASARTFYERFLAEAGDDPELQEQAADAALRLGRVEADLGESEQSFVAASRAESLARALVTRQGDDAAHRLLLHCLLAKGSAQHTLARLPDALATFEEARRCCDAALAATPDDPEPYADRLAIERALAMIQNQLQRSDEAVTCHRRLAQLWEAAAARTAGSEHHLTAVDHVLCATADEVELHATRGDATAAREALQRALDLQAEVPIERLPLSSRLAVARLALGRARLAAAEGDAEGQEAGFREALTRSAALLDDYPDHANSLRTRAAALNDLALFLDRAGGREAEVAPLYDEAIATLRRLIAVDAGVAENRANLAASLANVGARLQERKATREARAMFQEAAELAAGALAAAPTRAHWRTIVHNAEWFLGQACGELGDHAGQAGAAERLAAVQPDDPRTQRIAAELLAQSITALAADTSVPEAARRERRGQLEAKAMTFLVRAAELGCADFEWLGTSAEFAPLRVLPGFADVLRRVEANAGGRKD